MHRLELTQACCVSLVVSFEVGRVIAFEVSNFDAFKFFCEEILARLSRFVLFIDVSRRLFSY